jgi:hypothetical protein
MEFHAFAPLEASMRVTNGMPLGCLFLVPVGTVNFIQNQKVSKIMSLTITIACFIITLKAEPLMSDEQPGSWMFYEADLHTDRLSANEERAVAWNYRQLEFAPNELLPGFAFHQTDRDATAKQKAICPDARCNNVSRAADFDFLGYRYSVLSSVGTAGLNNVINMLPAKDPQEFAMFPAEDVAFVNQWMVRCAFSNRMLHLRMSLDPMHVRLKRTCL